MSEDAPEVLVEVRNMLEHNCNGTNNHHCRIVTDMRELPHGNTSLVVRPKTDNTGEYKKISGWSNVVRSMVKAESRYEHLLLNGKPGELLLVHTGGA